MVKTRNKINSLALGSVKQPVNGFTVVRDGSSPATTLSLNGNSPTPTTLEQYQEQIDQIHRETEEKIQELEQAQKELDQAKKEADEEWEKITGAKNAKSKEETTDTTAVNKEYMDPKDVKTSIIHDILNFITGDSRIADYKLKYISYTAGYNGEDLTGKVWSYTNNCDHRFYVFPETLNQAFEYNGDFALKKTYGDLDTILMKLPMVEIRSFQQHTLLQTIADALGSLSDNIVDGVTSLFSGEGLQKIGSMFKNLCDRIKEAWQADGEDPESLFGKLIKNMTPSEAGLKENHTALLRLPFIFYYALASATTRCYFTLPVNSTSYQNLWRSDSRQGWGAGGLMSQANLLNEQVDSINGVGDLGMGTILTTAFAQMFGMSFSPMFNAANIRMSEGDGEFEITFVLFNDTREHADANVKFLKVVFPLAMWSNVGIFTLSGDLFDVKIKGAMRWLMCTGSFSCKPVGAMRRLEGESRIPEAYEVSCSFKSLLPNNLNNYLLGYFTEFELKSRSTALGTLLKNIVDLFKEGGGGGAGGGGSGGGSAETPVIAAPASIETPVEEREQTWREEVEERGSPYVTAIKLRKEQNADGE